VVAPGQANRPFFQSTAAPLTLHAVTLFWKLQTPPGHETNASVPAAVAAGEEVGVAAVAATGAKSRNALAKKAMNRLIIMLSQKALKQSAKHPLLLFIFNEQ
jgi:hypothetical protein